MGFVSRLPVLVLGRGRFWIANGQESGLCLLVAVNQLAEILDKADDHHDGRSGQANEEGDLDETCETEHDCLHRYGW